MSLDGTAPKSRGHPNPLQGASEEESKEEEKSEEEESLSSQ